MLDFSDRTRTGISILTSAADLTTPKSIDLSAALHRQKFGQAPNISQLYLVFERITRPTFSQFFFLLSFSIFLTTVLNYAVN